MVTALPSGCAHPASAPLGCACARASQRFVRRLLDRSAPRSYAADISTIVSRLGVLPGSRVLEAGTGSGSLSTALISALAPSGHLHTFEFNAQRCECALPACRCRLLAAECASLALTPPSCLLSCAHSARAAACARAT